VSAECDKCGTDLVGTQWDGLSCPVCERADQIVADTALLQECRARLSDPLSPYPTARRSLLTRLDERLEEKG